MFSKFAQHFLIYFKVSLFNVKDFDKGKGVSGVTGISKLEKRKQKPSSAFNILKCM